MQCPHCDQLILPTHVPRSRAVQIKKVIDLFARGKTAVEIKDELALEVSTRTIYNWALGHTHFDIYAGKPGPKHLPQSEHRGKSLPRDPRITHCPFCDSSIMHPSAKQKAGVVALAVEMHWQGYTAPEIKRVLSLDVTCETIRRWVTGKTYPGIYREVMGHGVK